MRAQSPPGPADALPEFTIRLDVNLVQMDVIVTDASGRHVPDLKAEDFEVLQDGKPQKITHFSYIPAEPAAAAPTSLVPRQLTRAEIRRTILIFVDDLELDFGDWSQMRQDLLKFIDQDLQPGDFYAFYKTSGGSEVWQLFTSDPREIRAAVEHMTWPVLPPSVSPLHGRQCFRLAANALNKLAQLPGRKTMILLAGGIPISGDAARYLADMATRADVTVYALDIRGVPVLGAVPFEGHRNAPNAVLAGVENVRGDPDPTGASAVLESKQHFESQQLAIELAQQTGGLHLQTNDLAGELKIATRENAGYYLLGWAPPPETFSAGRKIEYRAIKIRVNRRGLIARSRAGFFSVPGRENAGVPGSTRAQMNDVLMSPFRSDGIEVGLNASFQQDEKLGPSIQSLVHIAADGIVFRESGNGCYAASLEVLATPAPVDADKENPGRTNSQMASFEACGQSAALMRRDGIVSVIRNRIDKPGAYEMRIAVRNTAPGDQPSIAPKALATRIGSDDAPIKAGSARQLVEVPDLRKTDFAPAGIQLAADGPPVPLGMQAPSGNPDIQMFYRPTLPADPAVREFRAGEVLSYVCQVVDGHRKAKPGMRAEMQIVYKGVEIHSEPVTLAGGMLRGTYRVDAAAESGQYVVEISVYDGSAQKKTAVTQRIDYYVAPR